jgi:hypothetical protein
VVTLSSRSTIAEVAAAVAAALRQAGFTAVLTGGACAATSVLAKVRRVVGVTGRNAANASRGAAGAAGVVLSATPDWDSGVRAKSGTSTSYALIVRRCV